MSRIHRRHFLQTSAAVGAAALLMKPVRAKGVNEKLNLGFIGCGGRSKELLPQFKKLSDVRIAALCDVDEQRVDEKAREFPDAQKYVDLRKLLDDKNIDAVAIATCNHWHVLAAIWACQAGKDVYVEKPLSHNNWEGQQLVKAARKYDRIVQMGSQQRSDPMQAKIKEFIHTNKELGEVKYAQVCRFAERKPIGKRSTPLEVPKTVNYDLWLGPAKDEPLFRDQFHYDWHWDWNTGNGEHGNWGVHVLDDALNTVLLDGTPFPKRLASGGGRVLWKDAGNTPNVSFSFFETNSVPILFGLSNLAEAPKMDGEGTGYVIHCENGYYAGGRGAGAAHDKKGKVIQSFRGDKGDGHQRNFVDAVFAHDRKKLNAEVETGHHSTAWCNLAAAATRAGGAYNRDAVLAAEKNSKPWDILVETIEKHLQKSGVDPKQADFKFGPVLEFDGKTEKFVGQHADFVNPFLKREYRKGFEVPEIS